MIKQSVQIVIPVYNEAKNLEPIIKKCFSWLRKHCENYGVLIVDDGSTDNTGKILRDLIVEFGDKLTVITHSTNLGIGKSWRDLYAGATAEFIFTCPADGQSDPEDFTQAIPYLDKVDIISFYRIDKEDYNWFRNLLSSGNRLFNRIFFGLKIKDCNWIKFYKRETLQKLDIQSESSLLETEILAKAKKQGKKIIELPSTQYERLFGESGGASGKNVGMVLKDLFNVYRLVKKF